MEPLPAYRVFGVASTPGIPASGAEGGAPSLLANDLADSLRHYGDRCQVAALIEAEAAGPASVDRMCASLAGKVEQTVRQGIMPWIIGGGEALAVGTWRGVAAALGRCPGLLRIGDGNPHCVPLARLLGVDGSGAALDPARVVVIGAHGWDATERAGVEGLGVTVFSLDETRRRGLAAILRDALEIIGGGVYGVSIDVDALDPLASGFDPDELATAARGLARRPDCRALEILGVDPQSSAGGRTAAAVVALGDALVRPDAATLRAWETDYGARNYAPLPVVLTRGAGVWVWDVDGRRYLDMMSAYSAVSCGHAHPHLVATLTRQAGRLAVTSRAFANDRLPPLLRRLSELTGYARVLPMNSGAEGVETALKAARKWAYTIKGVAAGRAEIIGCTGNFHGRTIAVVGLSSEAQYREGFGPFPPGLKCVPYGDAPALEAAITADTAAFLVEPIQGEGGIVLPPAGYLAACADICRRHDVLLIADEVQTGLGRTGRLLACEHDGVRPDAVVLGKALGGGLLPISALLADERVMQVFRPGDHGSTFGGNPLAASVALATLDLLVDGGLIERAARLGEHLLSCLRAVRSPLVLGVRGRGLFAGVDIDRRWTDARTVVDALLDRGVLSKDTHGTVVRFAPPLVIGEAEIDMAAAALQAALDQLAGELPRAA